LENFSSDNSRAYFLAQLESVGDLSLCRKFVEYRLKQGDFVPSERSHGIDTFHYIPDSDSESEEEDHTKFITRIEYDNVGDNKRVIIQSNDEHKIPHGATNIVINSKIKPSQESPNLKLPRVVLEIKESLMRKKQRLEDFYKANLESAKERDCKILVSDLPEQPFAYVAANLHYSDYTENHLVGVDAHMLQLAKQAGRETRVSMTSIDNFLSRTDIVRAYHISDDNSRILQFKSMDEVPESQFITDMHTEHDDQGGYDTNITRVHCVILVGPKTA
jgi:hypothetical protein